MLFGLLRDCFLRIFGSGFIQIPTTTIAQSDSSYGGKTAVDTPAGKNLIGMFKQPCAVFVDTKYLETLNRRNYINGLVEVVKYGLIFDKKLFGLVKNNLNTLLERKGIKYGALITRVMLRSINIKRQIVINDEKEKNLRKILNYGHTIGHAVEMLSGLKLLHGEASAIGICAEAYLAYKENILSKEDFLEQKKIFDAMELKTQITSHISTKEIIETMKINKKAREQLPEFILIKKIGVIAVDKKGNVTTRFTEEKICGAINEYKTLPD